MSRNSALLLLEYCNKDDAMLRPWTKEHYDYEMLFLALFAKPAYRLICTRWRDAPVVFTKTTK